MTNSCTTMLVSHSAAAGTLFLFSRGEDLRHVLGLGRGEQHLGADQRPGEIGAEHRDEQADADEHRAPVPDHGLQHRRHRGLAHAGDLGARQHRIGQQGDQHHQRRHADEAEDGRPADVGAFLGEARIDARALDAEEHEHGDQHGRADLLEHAGLCRSPPQKLQLNRSSLKATIRRTMKTRIGTILATVTMVLMTAACCTPRRIMKWNSQMPTEATTMATTVLPSPNTGKERAERRLDQHPVGDVADAAADPVAEGRQEARIVAEARLGIGEDAGIEVGLALGQRLEHARQHVHAACRRSARR